jgi:hypothetical protein
MYLYLLPVLFPQFVSTCCNIHYLSLHCHPPPLPPILLFPHFPPPSSSNNYNNNITNTTGVLCVCLFVCFCSIMNHIPSLILIHNLFLYDCMLFSNYSNFFLNSGRGRVAIWMEKRFVCAVVAYIFPGQCSSLAQIS